MKHHKLEKISLKNHPEINEDWVNERISEDPKILGLGELIFKDKERIQPKAGRLDILLQNPDTYRRYEVEVQLGKTDPTHIIRTLEYWDIERKRYPQYEHCAVIVAEDITSRFLNVISLFNGNIPIIAIKMTAYQIDDDHISLTFTKVLDEIQFGLEEEEKPQEMTDRAYWEEKGTKETVSISNKILNLIHTFNEDVKLNYNKYYIGLTEKGKSNNFASFKPRKKHCIFRLKIESTEEIDQILEDAGLEMMDYNSRSNLYRIYVTKDEVNKHAELFTTLLKMAYNRTNEFPEKDENKSDTELSNKAKRQLN